MKQDNRDSLILNLQSMMSRLPEVRGKGFHYPKELKHLAGEILNGGTTPKELAELTGISSSTLSDWKTKPQRKAASKFHQVKVAPTRAHELSIKTPHGHQVFGLCVSDIAHLLKAGVL